MDSVVGMLALYFIIWWTTLFAILPLGVSGQWEGEVVHGTEAGAPQHPRMWRKVLITTIVSAVIFGIVQIIMRFVTL